MWHQTVEELKKHYPKVGVGHLCGLFGKTRHAFYDRNWYKDERQHQEVLVLEMVHILRREMPKLGTRKLYFLLTPFLYEHKIKIGRDNLHCLLQSHGLVIEQKKRYARTTFSNHWLRKYPNLIINFLPSESEQLWVSDITYISLEEGFNYLSLITDNYSKMIVGYCLHPTLESEGCIHALTMALKTREKSIDLIHHSDRGIQYCSSSYVEILNSSTISISMTNTGSPYENAAAERVNGILKSEFGLNKIFRNRNEALKTVKKSIITYNTKRPHASCDYLTPNEAHTMKGKLKKRWKSS